MISNFPQLVKKYLGHLPQDDYPVLNTFLFVSTWLEFVLDQSHPYSAVRRRNGVHKRRNQVPTTTPCLRMTVGQTTMRSLFKRLNIRGIKEK